MVVIRNVYKDDDDDMLDSLNGGGLWSMTHGLRQAPTWPCGVNAPRVDSFGLW